MLNKKNYNEEDLDFKDISNVLSKYKYMILFLVFFSTSIAVIIAYFSPNIYSSKVTLEVVSEKTGQNGNTDMLSMAFGISDGNIDNELDIIRSRFVATTALQNLSIGTRYYTINKYKEIELYKNSPFLVNVEYLNKELIGKKIMLVPLNDLTFRLKVSLTPVEQIKSLMGLYSAIENKPDYNQVHKYGETINSEWGKLTINRSFKLENEFYLFSYKKNDEMSGFILDNLSVSTTSKLGSVVNIVFKDNVASRAKDIVIAISEAYLSQEIERNTYEAGKTLGFIDFQLDIIYKSLQASADSLNQYKSNNQLIDLESKAALASSELSELESQFYAQNIELELLENLYTHISENNDISSLSLQSSFSDNNDINNLFTELQIRETKKKSLLIEFTKLHPDVLKLTEEITSLKNVIKSSVKNKLVSIKNKKRQLLYVINKHKETLKSLPEQEKELASLTRTYMVDEKIYSFLLEKRAETAILKASTVTKTRIIDSALIASNPIAPNRVIIVITGIILGFMLGFILAIFKNILNNKILRLEELERITNIPIYASLSIFNKKNKQPFYEALRVLRANLQFIKSKKSRRAKVIVITSSIPGEGKTLVSVELSKILAQSEQKVLIIDLDMRKSKLQKHFNVSNQHGMSTYLAEKSYKEAIIQHTELVNLDVITAGAIPPNPSELLILSTFENFIEELSNEYDYIVLDTPPIGLVTDAMTPLLLSDVSLFIVKADHTSKDHVRAINKMVEEKLFPQAGFIFNGTTANKNYGSGYGYGYGNK